MEKAERSTMSTTTNGSGATAAPSLTPTSNSGTTPTMMKQYALVSKAEPLTVMEDSTTAAAGTTTTTTGSVLRVREELLELYEAYAEAYPNAALQEENHERDRLLRAVSAADHAVQLNNNNPSSSSGTRQKNNKKGWLTSILLGFGNSGDAAASGKTVSAPNSYSATTTKASSDEDDRFLKFTEVGRGAGADEGWLLGTEFSLDATTIPQEAHAAARRLLCNTNRGGGGGGGCHNDCNNRTSNNNNNAAAPNVARTAWESAGGTCGTVVTGLGTLAEFKVGTAAARGGSGSVAGSAAAAAATRGVVQHTSDRQQLLDYAAEQQKVWKASQARAATIGPNLLVVCWGMDGFVVFYRRIAATPTSAGDAAAAAAAAAAAVAWEAVAFFGATKAVQESLADIFLEEEGDSTLLGVTDLVPLVVESQHKNQGPAATLAVARLGGFLELVPLPPQMWYGPELPVTKQQRRKHHKRKPGEHYAVGKLPDLASSPGGGGITALTTSDYHSDVLGLEAFRTSVAANDGTLAWNQEAYPNGPPAEHVLAAYGTQQETGHQVITFWSVSTILSEGPGNIGFSLHATLSEVLNLGKVGPDITLFASPEILRHWRKPRQVDLRDLSAPPSSVTTAEPEMPRVTTLSVSAPIVGLRFAVSAGDGGATVRAAVLDWNGGVTILDCSLLEKAVSQSLSEQEYNLVYRGEKPDAARPLVTVLVDRSRSMQKLVTNHDSPTVPLSISNLQWFQKATPGSDSLALAALTGDPCALRLVFASAFVGSSSGGGASLDTTVVPCFNNGTGTLLRFGGRNKTLYLVFQSAPPKQHGALLNFCALQELSPRDIVQSFVGSSKFREAIAAAGSLTAAEQGSISDTIEKCKKQLWESELDFSVFESIKDDAYVVHEALYSSQPGDQQHMPALRNGDVTLFRSVCRLALKRIQSARLGTSLAIAGSIEEVKAITNEIRSRLIKVGTYELLCRFLSSELSLGQFIHDFLPVPPIDLAISFARTADIIPLSVLCFRHRLDILAHGLKFLDEIPLSVAPRSYQHLLPVLEAESADGHGSTCQFMAGADSDLLFDLSDMAEYLSRRFDCKAVVDSEDDAMVVEYSLKAPDAPESDGVVIQRKSTLLAEWYANRALAIQHFVSSFGHTSDFSKLALCGLRVDCADEMLNASSISSSVEKLHRLTRFAETFRSLLADENEPKLLMSLSTLQLESFTEMDTKDLVALIMNCKGDSVDLLARYNKYLLPMMKEKISGHQISDLQSESDHALQLFCTSLVADCGGVETSKAIDLMDAVTVCSKITWSSRTSIDKSSRIIKSKSVLTTLVLSLAGEVVATSSAMKLSCSDQRRVLDALWKMYESLPSALPPGEDPEGKLGASLKKMDLLYNDLIFLDIAVRWPGFNAFAVLLERISLLLVEKGHDSARHDIVGENAVALLCRSFCEQIRENRRKSKGDCNANALLSVLLGDIDEFNQICFEGKLKLKHLFVRHLFKPLLHQKDIGLLGEFLSRKRPDLIDSESISREVLLFFNDAVYGPGNSDNRGSSFSAAMECQDVLGEWLPELRREFQSIRQYLDAAHHIDTVLLPGGNANLRPEQIRKMHPLDVIEFVLEKNPKSLIRNCDEWDDPSWAVKANETIRLHTTNGKIRFPEDTILPGSDYVPRLPGQPIFHLAQLLGLEEKSAVIAVKSRAVHYGVASKLYGAAAAICRTLIVDTKTSNADSMPVLDAVAKTVSQLEFDDDATKQELCSAVLVQHSGSLSASKSKPFEAILNVWNQIEHHDRIFQHKTDGPMVSVRRFYLDIRNEYSVELGDLFLTLHRQLAECVMDDALLSALVRYTVFWCIGRATRLNDQPIGPLATLSTNSIIALAASLILHIRDESVSEACLRDLSKISGEQKTVALKALASSPGLHWTKPDPTIVQRLIERGYSEFGARRAAAMTKNGGFKEALQWAVMHSLDSGFDDPVVATKPTKELYVDYESAKTLESAVALIENIKSGSESLDSAIRSLKVDKFTHGALAVAEENGVRLTAMSLAYVRTIPVAKGVNDVAVVPAPPPPSERSRLPFASVPSPATAKTPSAPSGPIGSTGTLKVAKVLPNDDAPTSRSLPAPGSTISLKVTKILPKDDAPTSRSLPVPGSLRGPSSGSLVVSCTGAANVPSKSVLKLSAATKLKVPATSRVNVPSGSALPIPTKGSLKVPAASMFKVETTPPAVTRNVTTPSRQRLDPSPSSAPAPSPDRSTLLQVGQAAFHTARTTSSPASENRKHLIEEGRLLLQRVRSSSADPAQRHFLRSTPSTPTSTTPAVPTPPSLSAPPVPPPAVPEEDSPSAADNRVAKDDATSAADDPVAANDPTSSAHDPDAWDFDEDDLDI